MVTELRAQAQEITELREELLSATGVIETQKMRADHVEQQYTKYLYDELKLFWLETNYQNQLKENLSLKAQLRSSAVELQATTTQLAAMEGTFEAVKTMFQAPSAPAVLGNVKS